jgi:hypothetical protein
VASTYSPSLKLELIGNGDQSGTWGTTTNNNLGTLLEQAITGVQAITMSNADYVLTNYNGTSDEARNAVLAVSGTNSAIRQIVAPLVNKLYVVTNNTSGGYAITIGGVSGSAVTIPNGVTAQVYCDGTNFYSSQTGSAGNFTVNGTLTATGLTDTGNMNVGGDLLVGTTSNIYPSSGRTVINVNGTSQALFGMQVGGTAKAYILHDGTDQTFQNQANGAQIFATNNTERMRIDSSGNLIVGATSYSSFNNSVTLHYDANGGQINIGHTTSSTSGLGYVLFGYNNGGIGSITQNGTTSVLYNTTSDYRLKTDVTPITNALATVEALNPVSFTWADGRPDDGFLAHEIQAVLPNCVTGKKDDVNEDGTPKYQQMDNSGVIPFLVKAVQELKTIIDAQTARIAILEKK